MEGAKFGDRIRQLRKDKKKKLRDVASALGVSVVYVSDVERNRRTPPRIEVLEKWVEAIEAGQHFEELVALATDSRKRINIKVDRVSPNVVKTLLRLQKVCERGELTEEMAAKISQILS